MSFQRQIGGKVHLAQQVEEHYRKNFNKLVKRYQFRAGTKWAAEDIVQEAYLRALKYSNSFKDGLEFDNWFSRILANTLKDYKRAERDYAGLDELDEEDERVEDESYPDKIKLEIQRSIRELPVEIREVVELNLLYGYDMRQIVQIVNMKYRTIDQILQRFKKDLKEKYQQ